MRRFFIRDKQGQSLLEFALLLPILLLVLFGITEIGRAIMVTNVLYTASREGARLAAVSAVSDSLSVRARVVEVLDAASITAKDINIQFFLAEKTVQVTVITDFEVFSGVVVYPFAGTFELRGETVMRYEG